MSKRVAGGRREAQRVMPPGFAIGGRCQFYRGVTAYSGRGKVRM
jgi:hypothetical protein